ncbi:MAG: hypothetical protein AMXMBFR33_40380 [Candidatus Xenobia bacterium]
MRRRRTASLRDLLTWGVTLLLLLTSALVFGCLVVVSQLQQSTDWTTHSMQVQLRLKELRQAMSSIESQEYAFWMTGREEYLEDYDFQKQAAQELLVELEMEVGNSPEQREKVALLGESIQKRLALSTRMVSQQREGQHDAVQLLVSMGEPKEAMDAVQKLMVGMESTEQGLLLQRRASMEKAQTFLLWLLGVGLVLCLGVGSIILTRLSRRLEPLADCAALADKIGKGDLSLQPLPIRAEDEVGGLTRRLNDMLENLRQLTVQNRGAAEKLGAATRTILTASGDQARYVAQQSEAVQETSATMASLGESANRISDLAREVVARAEATSKASELGLQAVEENVRSTASTLEQVRVVASKILALNEKTQAIGDIVSTVNDLSERSNVLALNAAILAAASTEGKTFAVVANEMKSLAEQSKDATVQVRGLLGDIERGIQASVFLTEEAVKRGETGSIYTDQVNATIQKLAANIQESLLAFQQIVAATDQQRLASEQVNLSLGSIRQASSQTAESTHKLEASARELHELSQALVATMERYRLRHESQS